MCQLCGFLSLTYARRCIFQQLEEERFTDLNIIEGRIQTHFFAIVLPDLAKENAVSVVTTAASLTVSMT